jgi:hypothetical protein
MQHNEIEPCNYHLELVVEKVVELVVKKVLEQLLEQVSESDQEQVSESEYESESYLEYESESYLEYESESYQEYESESDQELELKSESEQVQVSVTKQVQVSVPVTKQVQVSVTKQVQVSVPVTKQVQEPKQLQSQFCKVLNLLLEVLIALPCFDLEKFWPANSTLQFLMTSKYVNDILNKNEINLPMGIFIRNFDNKLQNICKENLITKIKIITDITSYDIAKIFRECENLKELDISGCHIKNITDHYINTTSSLTCINLSNITCDNINEIVYFISLTLSQCQSLNLNKVIISNNNLHDSGASKICIGLGLNININIQVLDLSNNDIGSFGFSALSKILKNSNIRDLNLSGNNLQKGGFSCIFKALSTATKLERLNLSNTKINLNCLLNLVHKKLIFKNLVKLDLSENNICNLGLEIIAKFINNFFVKIGSLNLSDNNITIKGAVKFINELTNCKKMKIIVWDYKNYNNITPNFKTSHSYRQCKTLTSLDLSYNRINLHELEKQINL